MSEPDEITDMRQLSANIRAIQQALGHLVMTWNHVDQSLVELMGAALKQDPRSLSIITAHMSSEGRIQALLACLSEMEESDIGTHIRWACNYTDRLRIWRNHYVHSVLGNYASEGGGELRAMTYSMKAKRTVVERRIPASEADLMKVAGQAATLHNFIFSLCLFIRIQNQPELRPQLWHPDIPYKLPAMPPLPERWEDYLQAQSAHRPPR